ncbi:folate/biopterin transporter [Strigomonas culicis]|uniref:Folate/biopterin transporter n=1 Tax=Strigomonas culicis TaxID=28005 RepID=S9U014_9TRYP|nr:folate/biopterin transporter [Strigomonas culicis]|eukprot:EPY22253.1 folate/biopterin transporter [Strigomonas culicis]
MPSPHSYRSHQEPHGPSSLHDGVRENSARPNVRYAATAEGFSEHEDNADVAPSHHVPRCIRCLPLLGTLCEAFNPLFVFSLGMAYFLNKGIASTLIFYSQMPMFLDRFQTTSLRYQRLSSLSTMGFSVKPFMAMITDTFAVFGYTKRWYMFISCIIGAAFTLSYSLLPFKPSSDSVAGAFLFLSNFCIASMDILSQGFYSRLMRRKPTAGPSLVSWVWWMIYFGYVVGSAISGPITDLDLPEVPVYIAVGFQFFCFLFFAFNCYGEPRNRDERRRDAHAQYLERQAQLLSTSSEEPCGHAELVLAPPEETGAHTGGVADKEGACLPEAEPMIPTCLCGAVEVNKEVVTQNWRIVTFTVLLTCAVVTLAVVTILGNTMDLLYTCIAVAVVCCGCSLWALPLTIAKATIFIYFYKALYLSIPGALSTFYVAGPTCVPGGPNFSYTFYYTISRVITSAAGMVGAYLFTTFFSKSRYIVSFVVITVLVVLASLFDLVIVKRWNISIGIPDHAMYLFGHAIVYEVVDSLSSMPLQMLMARLCPRGSESMVFSLMAGMANTGGSLAYSIGSLLMELAWPVDTKSRPCDFSNVPYLIIVGHLCLPLLGIPLAFLLLPNGRVCDNVVFDKKRCKKTRRASLPLDAENHGDGDDAAAEAKREPIATGMPVEDDITALRDQLK